MLASIEILTPEILSPCPVNPRGCHYCDVIMGAIASQITSLTIVYSTVYSGSVERKHQSSASLAFVRGIHRWPANSPHKWPVTRKMFPFDDVIISSPLALTGDLHVLFLCMDRNKHIRLLISSHRVFIDAEVDLKVIYHTVDRPVMTCLKEYWFRFWWISIKFTSMRGHPNWYRTQVCRA